MDMHRVSGSDQVNSTPSARGKLEWLHKGKKAEYEKLMGHIEVLRWRGLAPNRVAHFRRRQSDGSEYGTDLGAGVARRLHHLERWG